MIASHVCYCLILRARPSPLNFVTLSATPECAANMDTYFWNHLLSDLEDCDDTSEVPPH
jgi:hypothetical protein